MMLCFIQKCLVLVVLFQVLLAADVEKRVCPSIKIRISEDLNAFNGKPSCQIINGAVDIRLNEDPKQYCAFESRDYNKIKKILSKVEEIRDYLVITQTPFLHDLSLLPELKKIRGRYLVDDKYSMILSQNDLFKSLWIQKQGVIIERGASLIDTTSYLVAPERKTILPSLDTNSRIAMINWTLPVGVDASKPQNYLYTITYDNFDDHPDFCKRKVLIEKFISKMVAKDLMILVPQTPPLAKTNYYFELQLLDDHNKTEAFSSLRQFDLYEPEPEQLTIKSSVTPEKTVEIALKWTLPDHITIDKYIVRAFNVPDSIEPFDFELMKDEVKEKFLKELRMEQFDSANIGQDFLQAKFGQPASSFSFKNVKPSAQYYVSFNACFSKGSATKCFKPLIMTVATMKLGN